jgi:hypothetical protein
LPPSERGIIPRSAAIAAPEAVGVEVVINGGQALAQAPEQLDLPLLSATQMYRARPEAPVRYVPIEPFAVLTAVPVAAVLGDGDVLAAALVAELELLLLPHAATTSGKLTSATRPPTRCLVACLLAMLASFVGDCTRNRAGHQQRHLQRPDPSRSQAPVESEVYSPLVPRSRASTAPPALHQRRLAADE